MEQDVLARLKKLLDGGRIEPAMFFRLCALMGVAFAAAMAVASTSPAFAKTLVAASPASLSYADFVGANVIAYLDAVGATNRASSAADPFDDHYFVKTSGPTFNKFDKAPDPND